jgi:hypothetical protein
VEPATGKVLWEHNSPGRAPRAVQPQVVGTNRVLMSTGMEQDTALIEVARTEGGWTPRQVWASRHLRPSFNDFVVHEGCVYGFDNHLFCCIDLETGKRRWKDGRYGYGQVVLLAEPGLLLVAAEDGTVVLLAANPERHEERGRVEAFEGKTWNHPAVAHGRLYVRNAEMIACFDLGP